jgi:RNA polymerase sigma-70 factor
MTKSDDTAMLNEFLLGAWAEGRRRWPQVELPNPVFVRHVTRVLAKARKREPLAPVLEQLDRKGLYLACACVHGVPEAIQVLEKHYVAKLPALLGYLKLTPAELDDVCQEVRVRLLIGTARSGPKLAGYTGRGALLTWMQVMATRMARKTGPPAHAPLDESVIEALLVSGVDLERKFDIRLYGGQFEQAVHEAAASLPEKQRKSLRLHLLELPGKKIAPTLGTTQPTISRWLNAARQTLYKETKRRIRERLGFTSRQFKSLTNALRSHFDLSLSRYLSGDEEEKEGD